MRKVEEVQDLTAAQDLLRQVGHFRNGELTTPGGKLMIRFKLDFNVTRDHLWMLNNLTSGIRGCEKILVSRDDEGIIFIVFALGERPVRRNEAISIALAYRKKVNAHLALAEINPVTSIQTKRGISDRGGIRPVPYR